MREREEITSINIWKQWLTHPQWEPSTQIKCQCIISHKNKPTPFREMADFHLGTGNTQDKTGTSCWTRENENYHRQPGLYQKGSFKADLERIPLVKDERTGASLRIITSMGQIMSTVFKSMSLQRLKTKNFIGHLWRCQKINPLFWWKKIFFKNRKKSSIYPAFPLQTVQ